MFLKAKCLVKLWTKALPPHLCGILFNSVGPGLSRGWSRPWCKAGTRDPAAMLRPGWLDKY